MRTIKIISKIPILINGSGVLCHLLRTFIKEKNNYYNIQNSLVTLKDISEEEDGSSYRIDKDDMGTTLVPTSFKVTADDKLILETAILGNIPTYANQDENYANLIEQSMLYLSNTKVDSDENVVGYFGHTLYEIFDSSFVL